MPHLEIRVVYFILAVLPAQHIIMIEKALIYPQLWQELRREVEKSLYKEPKLERFLNLAVLDKPDFAHALAHRLGSLLDCHILPSQLIQESALEAFSSHPYLLEAAANDTKATFDRDPVCMGLSTPLLFFKGFQALQAYRVANWLWHESQCQLALLFQHRISMVFGVDIHPAASIGQGILMDHATGIVIGETAVIEDQVSMLHSVTLGGTGKEIGDRHPKIRRGVLIGAGATILGNIEIGMCAKIAAGSVVLQSVPPHTAVAGVPAKVIGQASEAEPALSMNQNL
jgi:serine O-acetyltransferase